MFFNKYYYVLLVSKNSNGKGRLTSVVVIKAKNPIEAINGLDYSQFPEKKENMVVKEIKVIK